MVRKKQPISIENKRVSGNLRIIVIQAAFQPEPTSQGFALISLRDMGVEEVRSQKSEWQPGD
jgi:hypothetical protein